MGVPRRLRHHAGAVVFFPQMEIFWGVWVMALLPGRLGGCLLQLADESCPLSAYRVQRRAKLGKQVGLYPDKTDPN